MIREKCNWPSVRMILFVVALTAFLNTAGMAEGDAIASRQAAQRRARGMARDLVATVLDEQLRQLEQNGFSAQPIYAEIEAMRRDIENIANISMARVVEHLLAAEQASGAERQQHYAAARAATREVVLQLGIARQSVSQRIRSAELVGQVGRMIELQRRARAETLSLSELPAERRADRAIGVLADQRDIAPLFARLVESLDEVATWDGEIAANASAARRWLGKADLDKELTNAEQALHRADYAGAAAAQESLLSSFEGLWDRLDLARREGRGAGDLLARIRDLLARQQLLRDEAAAGDAGDPPALALVEGQQTLATDVGALAESLREDPTFAPLQQQAEAAAVAATEALFVEDRERGLAEQARVLDRLRTLATLLESAEHDLQDRSAAELAQAIEKLEQARSTLMNVAKAAGELDGKPVSHSHAEELERAAETLTDAPAIAARIEAAAGAIRDNARPREAIQQARAALEETLADWKRAEIAVRIGELARAAEALERAAAAERTIAGGGDRPALEAIHGDVMAVARTTMEGIRPAAPQAADRVEEAIANGELLADSLTTTANGDQAAPQDVSGQSVAMSQSLSDAAKNLREVIGQSAGELVDLTETQMPPVDEASRAVETAVSAMEAGEAGNLVEMTDDATAHAIEADFASTVATQAAQRAASAHNLIDARAALERAAVSLAARRQQLEEARLLSEQLGQLAKRQQAAVDAIDASRDELAEAPAQAEAMSETQRQAAREMRSATQQFAATQRATGEAAARISRQRQLANAAIREALQAAGRLPVPTPPPEPAADATAQADATQQESSNETPPSPPGAEEPSAEQAPGTKTASSGASGQNQAGASSPGDGTSSGQAIGTELVPAAAHETAQMMAGATAQAAMSAMEAARVASDELAASDTGAPLPEGAMNPSGEGRPADSEATAQQGPAASTEGAPPAEGMAPSSQESQDAAVSGTPGGEAGWFAKLPPDVRAAIRAGSSQPAPRGYEEQLKRYFEAVEPAGR